MSRVYDTKLKIRDKPVVAYAVKSDKKLTKSEVLAKVNKLKGKLEGDLEMMVCVETDYGMRSGESFKKSQRAILGDDRSQSGVSWETTNKFIIYAWKEEPPANLAGGNDDENNDCLYNCIVKMISKYRLPKNYKNPEDLKTFLGLNRDDLISIELIPKIEKLYKMNINVVGDSTFTSSKLFPNKGTVNVGLYNEHYELNEELKSSGKLGEGLTKGLYNLILCNEIKKEGQILCYDGKNEFELSIEEYNKEKNNERKTRNVYINDYDKKNLT
jgi:hypothetical protein